MYLPTDHGQQIKDDEMEVAFMRNAQVCKNIVIYSIIIFTSVYKVYITICYI